jgi:hypothetical protein
MPDRRLDGPPYRLPGRTELAAGKTGLYDLEGLLVTGGGRYGDCGRRLWVSPLSG